MKKFLSVLGGILCAGLMIMFIGFMLYYVINKEYRISTMDCNEIVKEYPRITFKELPARCLIERE